MYGLKAEVVGLAQGRHSKSADDMLMSGVMLVLDAQGRMVARAIFSKSSIGASTVHCNVWTPNGWGHGAAGGWGYHKSSAALGEALQNAGYKLTGDVYGSRRTTQEAHIGGVGSRAMEEALLAVARVEGGRKFKVYSI